MNPKRIYNPYVSEPVSDIQHADPNFLPQTQYWVPAADVEPTLPKARGWTLGFRNIGRPTDERTIIATLLPYAGFGNSTQLLLPAMDADALGMSCLSANLSNFVLDFVASAKVQGANINWFIVEQLPVIALPMTTIGSSVTRPLARLSASTCSSSRTRLTIWSRSRETWDTKVGPSSGMRRTGDTYGHGWTRSTSTCTGCRERMRAM